MTDSLINVAGDSAGGALSLSLGDFASTAMLDIGYILTARFLGPESYGLYSLCLAAPTILASLIGLGLDSSALRFSAKYKAEKKYSRTLSTLNLVLTFQVNCRDARLVRLFLLFRFACHTASEQT